MLAEVLSQVQRQLSGLFFWAKVLARGEVVLKPVLRKPLPVRFLVDLHDIATAIVALGVAFWAIVVHRLTARVGAYLNDWLHGRIVVRDDRIVV